MFLSMSMVSEPVAVGGGSLHRYHSDLPASAPLTVSSTYGKLGVLGFAFSSAGPAAATFFTNPLDVSKVRLQMQLGKRKGAQALYTGTIDCLSKTFKAEGMRGIQSGLGPSVVKEGTKNLFRIGLFEPALYFLHPDQDTKPLLRERMIAGSFSGAMGSLLCNPLDLIKTRIQLQAISPRDAGPRYTGMVDAATRMARADGVKSLWSGTGVNIVRSVVATSAVLTVNSALKDQFKSPEGLFGIRGEGAGVDAVSSLIASLVAVTAMNPIDVVRTRLYNQQKGQYKNAVDCFFGILRNEGPLAFYKGAVPHVLRFGPHNVLTFVFIGYFQRAARKIKEYKQLQKWNTELTESFARFDTNGDGRLDKTEVENALLSILKEKDAGPVFAERLRQVTNEIMQKVDKDHSGSIEMAEFAAMCHELDCAARDLEIELVFKSLDRNGDGFVDTAEVVSAVKNLMPSRSKVTSEDEDHDTIETALRMASDGKPLVRVPMDFKMFKELCTDVPRITRESVVRSLLADAGVGLQ